MLSKNNRIPRRLFKTLLASRQYFNSEHFVLRVVPADRVRLAVSVSKKISKKAVARNKIRRRVYAMFEELLAALPSGLHLVIAKAGSKQIKGEELKNELFRLIRPIRN